MRRGKFLPYARAVALIALSLIMTTWVIWQFFTKPVPGGNDFLAHLTAWEAYLKHGLNPYSDEAAFYTQQIIRGRPARDQEDQNRLTYPFYSIVLHGPFALIGDYALARAAYMTLLLVALFAGVMLTLRLLDWRPPPWLLALLLAWAVLYYPDARGLILGQFAILALPAVAGALYLLARKHDAAAGALLVIATIKPTLVFLVVPFFLLWTVSQRRWRFVAGFGGTLAGLMIVSSLMLPSWLGDWLYRIRQYGDYTVGQSPVWLLTHQGLPALGDTGEILLVALLLAVVGWAWLRLLRHYDQYLFWWTFSLTLLISNLIVSRSATTNYVLLLIPTLWLFSQFDRRWTHGRTVIVLYLMVSFIGLWWLHATTVVGNQEQPIMFIPLPVVLGLLLVWAAPRGETRKARQTLS